MGRYNRNGNQAIESKVKIFILTSILDNRENWCFDLECIPETKKLKVIYENGTIKNIDFQGIFIEQELISKRFTFQSYSRRYLVKPIAYRKF